MAVEPETGVASVIVQSEVFAHVSVTSGLSPEIAAFAAEPGVVLAAVSAADSGELQASRGIAVPSVVLVPAFGVVVGADSFGHPTFVVFPNGDCSANCASSVEAVVDQSVHSASCVHTTYGLCSTLSIRGLHQNRSLEHFCNEPSPGYNTVSDTNDRAMDATTIHSRKRGLYRYQGQRKHCSYPAVLSPQVLSQIHKAAVHQLADQGDHLCLKVLSQIHKAAAHQLADQGDHLCLPVPWLEEELL